MNKLDEMLKAHKAPGVIGTKDGFGFGRQFVDERTGREITTWKEWERAGYKTLDSIKDKSVQEKAKQHYKRIKARGDRKLRNNSLLQ